MREQKAYRDEDLPAERTLRDVLNRMNYRLKRIQKGRPLKKRKESDAIFENVNAVKAASRADPATREISGGTKAKVALGDYSSCPRMIARLRKLRYGKGLGQWVQRKHSPNPLVVPRFIGAALLEAGKDRMNAVTTNDS